MKIRNLSLTVAVVSLLMIGGLTACKTQQNSTAASKKGWVSLSNGKNLDGWHTFHKEKADPCWTASDGGIMLDPSIAGCDGDLVTNKVYKNFILTLEWKISEAGNSGILIDVQEQPQYKRTYVTGPEMQVLDNEKASDNKKNNHLAGSLYDLIACDPSYVHPAGEWNKVKIKQDDGHLTFWMNDHKVVEIQMGSAEWKNLIANSKFRNWKSFGVAQEGHIALQDHGHKVWYKDIKIKEL